MQLSCVDGAQACSSTAVVGVGFSVVHVIFVYALSNSYCSPGCLTASSRFGCSSVGLLMYQLT